MQTSRYYLKHTAEPFVYAVEADDEGTILNALDVSDEHEQGGLCPHMLASLPLAARIDDVERLNRDRSDFEPFTPECRHVHHLMDDLLAAERHYRQVEATFHAADAERKALQKRMEAAGAKVHALLRTIQDRPSLPLFQDTPAVS